MPGQGEGRWEEDQHGGCAHLLAERDGFTVGCVEREVRCGGSNIHVGIVREKADLLLGLRQELFAEGVAHALLLGAFFLQL